MAGNGLFCCVLESCRRSEGQKVILGKLERNAKSLKSKEFHLLFNIY